MSEDVGQEKGRDMNPEPGPGYTVEVARVSAVGGSGGQELGAGTRYIELRRRKAPAWLKPKARKKKS